MRLVALIAASAMLLAACGADGAPVPPKPKAKTGITVSGEARFGVVYAE